MPSAKKILIVAGEASSDSHASELVKEISKLDPEIKFFGLGGTKMQDQGVKLYFNLVDLAVVGLFEVLKNLKKFKKIFNELLKRVDLETPKLAILVDYPGFNLRLAKELKKRNIPIIYYISPQVWAWGSKRVNTIKELVDRIIVFFQFEEELYKQHGIPVSFIGHPLLDRVKPLFSKQEMLDRLRIGVTKYTVALLPGSREKEVKNILPLMLRTASIIYNKLPDVKFLILRSSTVNKNLYNRIIFRYELPFHILTDMTYEGLGCADFAIVASGTATLETALMNVPMVILYKVSFLSWLCLKMMIKIKYIGIVNIIANKDIVPEFVQYQIKPEKIASYIIETLTNPSQSEKTKKMLSDVRKNLGGSQASHKAAQIILEEIKRHEN